MTRKIVDRVPDEQLQQDLERYRQRALELGAEDARIITSDMVLIDERVRAKCINPKCDAYGTNANCPPYAVDLDFARKVISNFRYGVLTWFTISPEAITDASPEAKQERIRGQIKNHEMIARLEAEAFYDGYQLALGFANGSCKHIFCREVPCTALTPGKGCSHALKARSSMEGWGVDAYRMAARAGWDIYPVGKATKPFEIPHGARLGLVMIY